MRAYFAGILLTFACVAPAFTASRLQKPLKLLTSLPMTRLAPAVVTINFDQWRSRKNSARYRRCLPQIAPAVADELKLHRRDSPLQFFAADGSVSKQEVVIDDFASRNVAWIRTWSFRNSLRHGVDGIFSPIGFKAYDFDMDFNGGKLNIISNDHCDGKVIYWPANVAAMVPTSVEGGHVTVPVTVDDPFTAMVDTGASTSTMRLDMARIAFGLTPVLA